MKIEINNLIKRYGSNTVLKSISMKIAPGIHGLLGSNGAGKTTLMRILATVLNNDGGEITWGSAINWRQPVTVKSVLGYLPQQFGMYKYLTVKEALKYVSILKDIPKKREKEHIAIALERTRLTDYYNRKAGQLSGGMLRRLGIAQAMLGEPKLLVMDEPSAGLDPEERINMRKIIREYGSGDHIVIISSHIVGDIESLCDDVSIMHKGEILVSGNTHSIQSLAKGRVREATVDEDGLRDLEKSSTIIHFQPIDMEYAVRFLTDDIEAGSDAPPTLEDSYTLLIKDFKEKVSA
jgi:ABC-2 type transport system ATP-binding protein